MYFPNAFKKSFLIGPNSINTSSVILAANTVKTSDLLPGQIGFYSGSNYGVGNALGTSPTAQAAPFYVAQGSWFKSSGSSDKIGVHGGYQESVKSKIINPKYISRVIKVNAKQAVNQVVKVSVNNFIAADTTYRLRLDIKGSPALRFLNHQLYRTMDAYTGCANATNPSYQKDAIPSLLIWKDQVNNSPLLKDMVQARVYKYVGTQPATGTVTFQSLSQATIPMTTTTGAVVGQKITGTGIPANSFITTVTGASSIVIKYPAQAVNPTIAANVVCLFFTDVYSADNLTAAAATFIPGTATLTGGTPAAYTPDAENTSITYTQNPHIEFTLAYTDTVFGNCTFTPTDKYDLEPLYAYASVVDESGNPCLSSNFVANTSTITAANPYLSSHGVETQAPVQASGYGETVFRDMILDGRYRQEAYPDSARVESLRMREIEQNPLFNNITRSGLYNQVLVLHNVPRWNNPNGMFDNDQYLLQFYVPNSVTDVTKITDFVVNSANNAQGTGSIVLETY